MDNIFCFNKMNFDFDTFENFYNITEDEFFKCEGNESIFDRFNKVLSSIFQVEKIVSKRMKLEYPLNGITHSMLIKDVEKLISNYAMNSEIVFQKEIYELLHTYSPLTFENKYFVISNLIQYLKLQDEETTIYKHQLIPIFNYLKKYAERYYYSFTTYDNSKLIKYLEELIEIIDKNRKNMKLAYDELMERDIKDNSLYENPRLVLNAIKKYNYEYNRYDLLNSIFGHNNWVFLRKDLYLEFIKIKVPEFDEERYRILTTGPRLRMYIVFNTYKTNCPEVISKIEYLFDNYPIMMLINY